jgi:hypothetical protein
MIFLLWVLLTSARGAFPTAAQSADNTKKQTAATVYSKGRARVANQRDLTPHRTGS